jgi:hypothetical protein
LLRWYAKTPYASDCDGVNRKSIEGTSAGSEQRENSEAARSGAAIREVGQSGNWEAIEGIRAGGDVRVLALGNSTIASGPFHDAFTSNRDGWCTFTISAFDRPNLTGLTLDWLLALPGPGLDHCVRPYLVTRRWVREKYAEWGPGHPLWEARVQGQFPILGEDALISLGWLEEAAPRPAADHGGRLAAGLDVAGPGENETVLILTEAERIIGLHAWAEQDARGAVVAALAPYRDRLEVVKVGAAGIGYYLAKHLQELAFPVRSVNVGERSSDRERYANLKAEFYSDRTKAQIAPLVRTRVKGGRSLRPGCYCWTCPQRADSSDVGVSPRGGSPKWGSRRRGTRHADGSAGRSRRSSRPRASPWCAGATDHCRRSVASST